MILKEIYKLSKNTSNDIDKELLILFIAFLIKLFHVVLSNNRIEYKKHYNDKRLEDAINYIKENISARMTVENVADYVHISKKTA